MEMQPFSYCLAAADREHFLRFGEIVQISGHLVYHMLVWLQSFDFHLSHDTLKNVFELQRKKRDEEVHHVLLNQAWMPQTTYRKRLRDIFYSKKIQVFHQIYFYMMTKINSSSPLTCFQVFELNIFSISSCSPEI